MQNSLLCYSLFKNISLDSCEHSIKHKSLSRAGGCRTTLWNSEPTCLYTLISCQFVSICVLRGPNPLSLFVFEPHASPAETLSLPSFQPFTWMAPPLSRTISASCSLVKLLLYLLLHFKYLSFSQIHPDTLMITLRSNMVPPRSIP